MFQIKLVGTKWYLHYNGVPIGSTQGYSTAEKATKKLSSFCKGQGL